MEFTSRGNIRFPIKAVFFESLGYLASSGRMTKLDAELPYTSQKSFEDTYHNLTGITPQPDNIN